MREQGEAPCMSRHVLTLDLTVYGSASSKSLSARRESRWHSPSSRRQTMAMMLTSTSSRGISYTMTLPATLMRCSSSKMRVYRWLTRADARIHAHTTRLASWTLDVLDLSRYRIPLMAASYAPPCLQRGMKMNEASNPPMPKMPTTTRRS